jgi:CRISPR-associated protein (TIGR03986 family)
MEDHSRYWSERYTGTIPVVLKTRAPLFITDTVKKTLLSGTEGQKDAHYCYDTLDYIPSTALKGMLSSAYEAITNSRYRVFSKKQHTRKLGMREQANPRLVPGRVRNNEGDLVVDLFHGTTGPAIGNPSPRNPSPLYAAWLPMYPNPIRNFLAGLNGQFKENVIIRLYRHDKGFRFWSVVDIDGHTIAPITHHAAPAADEPDETVSGYVVISGKIFNRKHDERFFFNAHNTVPLTVRIDPAIKKNYEVLIADYRAVHEGGANPPIEHGVVLGAHIMNPSRKTLRDGDFVYARMNGGALEALYPVQISREIYEKSPIDCAHPSILPAEDIDSLSPADRVFGWVSQGKGGAWKGKVRISDSTKAQVESFNHEPIPLAILGNPKPAQVRFYVGDQNGGPQRYRIPKSQAGYGANKKLRGRKVYLNQSHQDENYWTPAYWLNNFAEYYMRINQDENEADRRSGQNRSISSWIPIGNELRFDIKVVNLTKEELGALLTLLTLTTRNTERYLKMGYAKPLGFGSLTLELDLCDGELLPVYTGKQRIDSYASFSDESLERQGLGRQAIREIINGYKKALVDAYVTTPPIAGMPNIPATWTECQRATDIISTEDEKNDFTEKFWKASFESDANELSLDGFSLTELLLLKEEENGGTSVAEELQKIYALGIAAYRSQLKKAQQGLMDSYITAWSEISFISDFLRSTQMYENVYYPSNNPADKGYEWFVGNERPHGNAPVYGYSLPPIGIMLNETQ